MVDSQSNLNLDTAIEEKKETMKCNCKLQFKPDAQYDSSDFTPTLQKHLKYVQSEMHSLGFCFSLKNLKLIARGRFWQGKK